MRKIREKALAKFNPQVTPARSTNQGSEFRDLELSLFPLEQTYRKEEILKGSSVFLPQDELIHNTHTKSEIEGP